MENPLLQVLWAVVHLSRVSAVVQETVLQQDPSTGLKAGVGVLAGPGKAEPSPFSDGTSSGFHQANQLLLGC